MRAYLKHWSVFVNDIWQKMKRPWAHPPFVMYFVIIIIGVGGLGAWIEISKAYQAPSPAALVTASRSLSTYLLAILSAAAADLIISQSPLNRSTIMLAISVLIVGAALALIGFVSLSYKLGLVCSVVGTLAAWFLWIVANSDNQKLFEEDPPQTAPIGENPSVITGNIHDIGIKVE
jgi:hypothetical protein